MLKGTSTFSPATYPAGLVGAERLHLHNGRVPEYHRQLIQHLVPFPVLPPGRTNNEERQVAQKAQRHDPEAGEPYGLAHEEGQAKQDEEKGELVEELVTRKPVPAPMRV